MISTIARIASYAAKGIYAFLLLKGGAASRQELIEEAGYKSTVIHEAIVSLQAGGFVVKVGGTYRIVSFGGAKDSGESEPQPVGCESFGGAKDSFGGAKDSEITPESFGGAKDSFGGAKTESILESASGRKYKRKSSGGAKDSSAPPKDSSGGAKHSTASPLTLVNMNSIKKEKKAATISSTDEIPALIDSYPADKQQFIYEQTKLFYSMVIGDIPNVSLDILQRITMTQFVMNCTISLTTLNDWRKDAKLAVEQKRVRFAYIAFSRSVQRFYEEYGVKWTKCRPPDVIKFDNKMKVLENLLIKKDDPTPIGEVVEKIAYPDFVKQTRQGESRKTP
jgi:biotin operon repressor